MAFDNVTFFELHLDDARFTRSETPDDADDVVDEEPAAADGSGSGRIARLVVVSVLLSVMATLVARRLTSDDETDLEGIEIDAEAAEIEN